MVKQVDVYEEITNKIVRAIEAGADDFKMPWHTEGGSALPVNAVTGKPYRGVNTIALWADALEKNFSTGTWATYQQWQSIGAQVRKGERSSVIVFWKFIDAKTDEEQPEGAKDGGVDDRRMFARAYRVFNADQVDGYTPPALPETSTAERDERAEAFFASLGAEIRHGGNQAFYSPGKDAIAMPPFEVFRDAGAYYATLGHEVTHWTGAKHRLDRDMSGRFGDQAYAMEEMVAELGAAYLCADLGLESEPRPDHAAYIANWLQVLKSDNRAIFTAASKAQTAADYVHGLQPKPEMTEEQWRDMVDEANRAFQLADPEMDPVYTDRRPGDASPRAGAGKMPGR